MGRGRRSERRREAAVYGDVGPQTPAQLRGAEIVERVEGGARIRLKRRVLAIEELARSTRRRPARITPRQLAAGLALRDAWEETQRLGEVSWARVRVDGGRLNDGVLRRLGAQRAYGRLLDAVDPADRGAVTAIVIYGIRPREFAGSGSGAALALAALRRGLDAIADALGL